MSVLIIDDEPLARRRLSRLVAALPDAEPVGEAGDVQDAYRAIEALSPDIVLLDIQMPGLNGIEGVKVLKRHFQTAKFLIVSGTSGLDAISAEARKDIAGFLPKSADAREIEEAIACCLSGGTHFATDGNGGCLDGLNGLNGAPQAAHYAPSQLTPRQLEVLGQLNLGRSNKVIAYHLGLSENTVRVHVAAILGHLGVVSRVEAILEAQRRGLVQAQR